MQEVVQFEWVLASWLRGNCLQCASQVHGSASLEFPPWKMASCMNAKSTKVEAVFISCPSNMGLFYSLWSTNPACESRVQPVTPGPPLKSSMSKYWFEDILSWTKFKICWTHNASNYIQTWVRNSHWICRAHVAIYLTLSPGILEIKGSVF